jgi:hypothetical protein
MTLHIYPNLDQGSPEWLAARCGLVTASTVGKLITPTLKVADNETARGLILTLAAERITGRVEVVYPNADMQRGHDDEPYARDVYREHHNPVEEVGFITNEVNGFKAGYSPDGLIADVGLLEIKSRKAKVQITTILANIVPRENMAQLQMGLLISDRHWIDYASYASGLPFPVIRVHPDQQWFDAITAAITKAEQDIAEIINSYAIAVQGMPVTEYIDHYAEMSF